MKMNKKGTGMVEAILILAVLIFLVFQEEFISALSLIFISLEGRLG